ncbi:MAG: energy transducer TonB [Leptospiraceae bacterium]|nr:energy transducer TonB [Leptospiraceae bacterium]
MSEEFYKDYRKRFVIKYLFPLTVAGSLFFHVAVYAGYYIATNWKTDEEIDSSTLNQEVDILEEIPPELLGATSNPAPVEKQEWVEGKKEGVDDPNDDDLKDAISGNGTDKDGFLYSYNGDRPPTPIIDFDLKQYFPQAAKDANITDKVVVMLIQVDDVGNLISYKIVSGKAGYGFDSAAETVIKRARFAPGYVKGKPVKMSHRMSINFTLDE